MTSPSHRALALGALALALGACKPQEQDQEAAPIRPVLTRVAQPSDAVIFGPFTGTVEPRYQSQLGFQIPGRMVARDVTIGDLVKQGQRLAALDPVVTRFDLTRAEADLADARGQAENATSAEARTRRLVAGNAVSQSSLDQAVSRRDTARARLIQAEASLQKARDQMGYTALKAEFDGVVTQRLAEIGQVLTAGQGVVTVARPDARDAVVDIPEALVGAMPADGVFTVSLQSAPELRVRGRVRETAPFAEAGTRTRRIRMTLEQPGPAFRLGAMINVSLSRSVPRRFLLPSSALLAEGERRSVWVVAADGRSVSRRDVTLGPAPENEGEIAVSDGLRPGERVVVAGVHSIRDGQAVRLASAAE
ncbi:efflux RND transporter periplasmic adaptor subunit [Methylobacterium sp. J-076]|uniref:efflux RND transporter periplasmic adaptor subunit n=1 Tax=Methylobacterium sp. J-076 TaxID=2836655 RepID=UPI001FB875A6|nr:efflux RND transporter periplasmic adaptor subunit [Methylobacterium sp. J-076]MCJ2013038.1 efflux RND transporter periplasmic adaptor subunit [Methylobacterium sp. J-076]